MMMMTPKMNRTDSEAKPASRQNDGIIRRHSVPSDAFTPIDA